MNIELAEKMLNTLTVQQVAERLDITKDSLQYHLKMSGTDVLRIKHDYAMKEIDRLLNDGLTCAEMAAETGFCLRKVKKYRKLVAS